MAGFEVKSNKKYSLPVLSVAMLTVTVLRIYLADMIPMLLQGDAKYDDFLMIRYAETIEQGRWLGDYSHVTLIKTVSAPILMIIGKTIGLKYNIFSVLLYVLATFAIVFALKRLIRNNWWTFAAYTFLLYSPVMFHEENIQKVYRGGFIVPFALLVIAAVIGMFAYRDNHNMIIVWAVVLSISLPVFWYLKEDSIWILPFVIAGTVMNLMLAIWEKNDGWKYNLIITVIPIIVFLVCIFIYRGMNYHCYRVWTDIDRSNTYFEKTISDILHYENAGEGTSWITRDTMEKMCDNSPTLDSIRQNLMEVYDYRAEENGDVDGDFVIAVFREAGAISGLYDQNGDYTEEFYKNVYNELEMAYNSGKLARSDKIFISSIARGYSPDELCEYYGKRLKNCVKVVLFYEHNETGTKKSVGEEEKIKRMAVYAGDDYITDNTSEKHLNRYRTGTNTAEKIVGIYRKTGRPVLLIATVGFIYGFVTVIVNLKNKTANNNNLWIMIISAGLMASVLLLIVAVLWFCNFLTDWKVYDYCSAIIPVIELLEMIGIYFFICGISRLFTGYFVSRREQTYGKNACI